MTTQGKGVRSLPPVYKICNPTMHWSLFALSLLSCSTIKGPPGARGEKGDPGRPGEQVTSLEVLFFCPRNEHKD